MRSARLSACIDTLFKGFNFFAQLKMITQEKGDGKEFISHFPGYWPEIGPDLWNDWKWQLRNRVTTLAELEKHLQLSDEERSGVLLSGDKLALAVTPHFFNLLPHANPDDPIRRQMIPRVEETVVGGNTHASSVNTSARSRSLWSGTVMYSVDPSSSIALSPSENVAPVWLNVGVPLYVPSWPRPLESVAVVPLVSFSRRYRRGLSARTSEE